MSCVAKGRGQPSGACASDGAFSKIGSRAGNRDKLLKFGTTFGNGGSEIARLAGASEAVVDGFRKVGSGFGDARAVVGMFNTFEGTVQVIKTGRKFVVQAQGGYWDSKTDAKDDRVRVVETAERFWGALASFGDLISWIFFDVIFGVVAPCSFLAKHTQVSDTTKQIGSQFTLLMLCRDSASTLSHIAEPIRGYHELKRREGRDIPQAQREEVEQYRARYYQECGRNFVRFIKDLADVASGTIGVGGFSNVPKIAPVSLGFVSAIIGLVEIYWNVQE